MEQPGTGTVSWQSPSNIALVKYWGKKGRQFPANPSLSITLSRSVTIMTVEFSPSRTGEAVSLELRFDGKRFAAFEDKVRTFVKANSDRLGFLNGLHLSISTRNTFPHSSGIASSASSMSALALCLVSIEELRSGTPMEREGFFRKASELARLASGSACRSVYGGMVLWGKMKGIPGSSDDFAIPYPLHIHEAFRDLRDSILVVNAGEKKVSSRTGHALMAGHPLSAGRYALAAEHLETLSKALSSGDMASFIRITEAEALGLHALMMTSPESYMLIEPGTVHIVNKTKAFREKSGVPVCFSLDAGPNVHLLYPAAHESSVRPWIDAELTGHCQDGMVIHDESGNGPAKIKLHDERET